MNEYIEDNKRNFNFNGIEMRGLNSDHRPVRNSNNHEIHEVKSKCGIPILVYVQRSQKSTALVTMHDIGTNHTAFSSFLNSPEMVVILDNFTVYNICAPGHVSQPSNRLNRRSSNDEDFHLLSTNPTSEDNDNSKPPIIPTPYPNMDELADMVHSVVDHFQLNYCIGMGVGAGANVLARFGIKYSEKLLGLFLINPDDTTSGYYEWTKARWSDLPSLKTGIITDWMENYLLNRWFGSVSDAAERNIDVQQYYCQLLREINHLAVAGYIESYMNRNALGLVRFADSPGAAGRSINVDSFLITGELAMDMAKAMVEMNGNMNPTKTQFISIPDSSGMVLEEAPAKVANIFLNFLRNIGIMVTMTPEKLQKAVLERQSNNTKPSIE